MTTRAEASRGVKTEGHSGRGADDSVQAGPAVAEAGVGRQRREWVYLRSAEETGGQGGRVAHT